MIQIQMAGSHDGEEEESTIRRRLFGHVITATVGSLFGGNAAQARDELFKPNPLTNPVLEQVRTL